mgnify:CR=1 FL=1
MANFHWAVDLGIEMDIDVSQLGERIIGLEAAQGDYFKPFVSGSFNRLEDVRRAAGAGESDQQIAGISVHLYGLGKRIFKAVIIAQHCQERAVVKRNRPDFSQLGIIKSHVIGSSGTAAIADEDDFFAGGFNLIDGG